MTDKQIIETFRNIRNHCEKVGCIGCCFAKGKMMHNRTFCQIRGLAFSLSEITPDSWDMEEIERIINE